MANENYDYSAIEEQLKQRAREKGVTYDPTDLEGVKRNSQYDKGGITPEQALSNAFENYDQRAGSTNHRPYDSQTEDPNEQRANADADRQQASGPINYGGGNSGGGGGGNTSAGQQVTQAWSGQGDSAISGFMQQLLARQTAADEERRAAQAAEAARAAELRARGDELYSTLKGRANQSLTVDRNDPAVRAEADAYAANETRASRDFLADLAERAGPTANLLGEQRLAAERVGQRTGTMEAELMNRLRADKRAEIAEAMRSMGGMLTAEQQMGLQKDLALLDDSIKRDSLTTDAMLQNQGMNQNFWLGNQRLGLDRELGTRGLDIDMLRAMLQNEQYNKGLGFQYWDRDNYWKGVR